MIERARVFIFALGSGYSFYVPRQASWLVGINLLALGTFIYLLLVHKDARAGDLLLTGDQVDAAVEDIGPDVGKDDH